MRTLTFLTIVCIICSCGSSPEPSPNSVHMSMKIEGKVSKQRVLPIELSFANIGDHVFHYKSTSFLFVLFNQDGEQVGNPNAFVTNALISTVEINKSDSIYRPRLLLNPQRQDLPVGRKYQLVAIIPSAGLAASAWFTLDD
jgi:hypothetical protein